jgi:hypothetical protein
MMIDIQRLFGSDFDAMEDDSAWRFGVTLWLKSFHQLPAASLPDDDRHLAKLCGLGRDISSWLEVKDLALANWVRCDDGRIYHKVVAEVALECWIDKLTQLIVSSSGNAAHYGIPFDRAAVENEIDIALTHLFVVAPTSRMVRKVQKRRGRKASEKQPFACSTNRQLGTLSDVRPDTRPELQGEREGEGEAETNRIIDVVVLHEGPRDPASYALKTDDWPSERLSEKLTDIAGPGLADPARCQTLALSGGEIVRWMQGGCSWELDVIPTVRALTARARASPIVSWKFFEIAILACRDRRLSPLPSPQIMDKSYDRPDRQNAKRQKLVEGFRNTQSAAMAPLNR